MYSLRLHWFIVLDHPKECMLATLGTRLFSTVALTLKNSLPAHILISNHCFKIFFILFSFYK